LLGGVRGRDFAIVVDGLGKRVADRTVIRRLMAKLAQLGDGVGQVL
jgi:hypothetical protein